jgi:hypothetical protein
MESCGIGKVIAWRKLKFGAKEDSILVEFPKWTANKVAMEKKQITCPNGSTPLAVWVDQPVNAAGYACRYICDHCYRELYGGAALPKAYMFAKAGEVGLDPLRFFR